MTTKELQAIEAELEKRGYRKWTTALTSSESWVWFRAFYKDEGGYQIAFRVWDFHKYVDRNAPSYGFDFWTSPIGTDSRMDFTSNWEPICDIDTFERMAAQFNQMVRKYVK